MPLRPMVLPAGSELLTTSRNLGWLACSGGLTKERARAILRRRWKNLDSPLLGLRDRLVASEPNAVIKKNGRTFLGLVRPPPAGLVRGYEVNYLIPGPPTSAAVRKALRTREIEQDPLLVQFLVAFDGLRDRPIHFEGGFVPHDRWKKIDRSLAPWGEAWGDHYVMYRATNGDQLLYSATGRIGWFNSAESSYQTYWKSFASFLRFYTRFQDHFQPLDGYSTHQMRQK